VGRHRFTLLDVFTSERLSGNGLAVVHDADDLTDTTMARFAREMKLSETSFVQSPDAGGHYRHRIFMPTGEIPFAGHPSLGTAVAVALERGEDEAEYRQQTQAGRQWVLRVLHRRLVVGVGGLELRRCLVRAVEGCVEQSSVGRICGIRTANAEPKHRLGEDASPEGFTARPSGRVQW